KFWTSRRKAVRGFHFSTRLRMKAGRSVTGFAASVDGIRAPGDQARVVSRLEVAVNLLVALLTGFRARVFRSGNIGKRDNRSMHGLASEHGQHQHYCGSR